ncbi:leucyl aminopeptidase [Abditibacterium utsteinense]|uniref:Probable cytosol aminopeptidase n=1 Tax=Abditibacterium utsteinense TaxID=1960156 RepID=A0A2S8SUU6_9BACT|nr:leucyl aminopeptidase [Abditibacterium utsteinense]PQV64578.1 leucyl aminopeptidase [Abditibacterium utsteinense]
MMNIAVSSSPPLELSASLLVLPLFSDSLTGISAAFNDQLSGLIAESVENDGFKAKCGETRLLINPNGAAKRVLLLGIGARDQFSAHVLRRASAKAIQAARALKKLEVAFVLPQFETVSGEEAALAAGEGLQLGAHVFEDFKTGEKSAPVEQVTLLLENQDQSESAQKGLELSTILSEATLCCRALVNAPSNLKTPETIAQAARDIAQEKGLRVEVWDETRILEEKMGALYGVGMGSACPPRFIVLEYVPEGMESEAPIALVGKGMSFDTGGYSLKPSTSMEDMKDDMAGAAVVLSAMSALADLKIARRVLGVIPSAENMVSDRAQRPGDIVTARGGKTIEVLNTDAEGRLILADALVWTCEQKPAAIMDFATLTGAIGTALGQEAAGLFSNDNALSAALAESGERVAERVWRLPLWEEYREAMKGSIADLKNISGDRYAGSITAAVFLEEFVEKGIPWAHFDIAAVSLVKKEKYLTKIGATGFGVRMILDFLRNS